MCLAATKFVLRKIKFQCLVHSNIFTVNALHAQFSTHFLNCKHADNESIPHSFTEKAKPSKKIHQIGAGEIGGEDQYSGGEDEIARPLTRSEARSVRSSDSRRDRRARRSSIAVLFLLARRTIAPALSSSSLSLRSGLSLSLFSKMI